MERKRGVLIWVHIRSVNTPLYYCSWIIRHRDLINHIDMQIFAGHPNWAEMFRKRLNGQLAEIASKQTNWRNYGYLKLYRRLGNLPPVKLFCAGLLEKFHEKEAFRVFVQFVGDTLCIFRKIDTVIKNGQMLQ